MFCSFCIILSAIHLLIVANHPLLESDSDLTNTMSTNLHYSNEPWYIYLFKSVNKESICWCWYKENCPWLILIVVACGSFSCIVIEKAWRHRCGDNTRNVLSLAPTLRPVSRDSRALWWRLKEESHHHEDCSLSCNCTDIAFLPDRCC